MATCACCGAAAPAGAPFRHCTKCVTLKLAGAAAYCSKECQKEHWPEHRAWHKGMAELVAAAQPPPAEDEFAERLRLGMRACGSGDTAAGVAHFRRCVELRPEQAVAHANLGYALRDGGDFPGAVPALLRAAELFEEGSEQWATTSAVAYFAVAESQTSVAELPGWVTGLEARVQRAERCAEAAPNSMQVQAMLGMALAEQEADLGRAAQALMRAAALTDAPATKQGYTDFARGLLQRVQADAAGAREDE